jgi:hypothetical protein
MSTQPNPHPHATGTAAARASSGTAANTFTSTICVEVFAPNSIGSGPFRASSVERSSIVVTCYLPATVVTCVVTGDWGDYV